MCTRYTGHRGSEQDENREIALPELLGTPKELLPLPHSSKAQVHLRSPGRNTPLKTPHCLKPNRSPPTTGTPTKISNEIPPHTPAESPSNTIALTLPSAPRCNRHPRPHQPVHLTLHILIPYSYTIPILTHESHSPQNLFRLKGNTHEAVKGHDFEWLAA